VKTYKRYVTGLLSGLWLGVACGAVTGGVVFFYKWAAKALGLLSTTLYGVARGSAPGILLSLLAAAGLGLLMWCLHRWAPHSRGGGIPRSEGALRGTLPLDAWRTLPATAVGSLMSFFGGLPVGSEGPAVLMGTCLGSLCSNSVKNKAAWRRYAMTGGAGAGFAVATGAPLTAILFTVEEFHQRFTPLLMLVVPVAVVAATAVNTALCGVFGLDGLLFPAMELPDFQPAHIGYLLVLGVFLALAVGAVDQLLSWVDALSRRQKGRLPRGVKLVGMFLLAAAVVLVLPQAAYSGHDVTEHLLAVDPGVKMALLLLAVRLVLFLLVGHSGVTGGQFIPTLALGALLGTLVARALMTLGLPVTLYLAVVYLSMCAFMGGMLRAPLTAALLFVELVGGVDNLLYVALVVFTVHLLVPLFHQRSHQDRALERLESEQADSIGSS
jgi:CIC family chloride channel protein